MELLDLDHFFSPDLNGGSRSDVLVRLTPMAVIELLLESGGGERRPVLVERVRAAVAVVGRPAECGTE